MARLLSLLFIMVLAITLLAGSLFLSAKINAGDKKVAEGQVKIAEGKPVLAAGKASLEEGKRQLSAGKKEYADARDNGLLVWADKWLHGGKGFEAGRQQIADGDEKVAQGEEKIAAEEKHLDAGEQQLGQGKMQLRQAREIRAACELGAMFLTVISIGLGIYWRKSLARTIKHAL